MAAATFTLNDRFFEMSGARNLRIDGNVRGLNAGSKAHGTRPHRHNNVAYSFLGVNFVLRGRGRYIDAAGKSYELEPGVLFHRFPGVLHSTHFDPTSDYAEFYVVFDTITGDQLLKLGLIAPQPVIKVGIDPIVLEEFKHLVKQLRLHEFQVPSRDLLIEGVRFVNGLYKRERNNRVLGFWDRTIQDACLMLEHNLDERVRLESIAEKLGVSYAAFRKHFTKTMGLSPNDYRIRHRLEASQQILLTTSVKEVAQMLGYCDSFAFSAQFKRRFGISPSAHQRRQYYAPVVVRAPG
jgi:AraC-like DNA-binding protein